MNVGRLLIGKPLETKDLPHQAISKPIGLAVFASDALSSTAYATEEILLVLVTAGAVALSISIPIASAIAVLLVIVGILGVAVAVIVIAEGAGQHLFPESERTFDASGNPRLQDIGPFLKQQITEHFQERGKPVELKYIDPSYMVRSVSANTDDSLLCDRLARNAAHAAMAGKSDLVVSLLNDQFALVPIELVVAGKRHIADLVLPKSSSLSDLDAEQLRTALGLRPDALLDEENL